MKKVGSKRLTKSREYGLSNETVRLLETRVVVNERTVSSATPFPLTVTPPLKKLSPLTFELDPPPPPPPLGIGMVAVPVMGRPPDPLALGGTPVILIDSVALVVAFPPALPVAPLPNAEYMP